MSATVTGLSVGTPYTFYVAMSQTRGWGPRSQGLAVTTTATCASPTDQSECTGIAMGAPLVSPLNCVAMLLEVPSGGPCFSSGREVVVQMRVQGQPWADVRRDVRSSTQQPPPNTLPTLHGCVWLTSRHHAVCTGTVIIGDLDPFQACQFRLVLRRVGQPDWVGQSTPSLVTEDGNSTISAAPLVVPLWRDGAGSAFALSWGRARGLCRGQSRFELQAAAGAEVSLSPAEQTWTTIADDFEAGAAEAECPQCCLDPSGCIFRVRPLDVRGWSRPGSASAAAFPASPPAEGGGILPGLLRLLLLLVLLSPVAVVVRVVARSHSAGRSINLPEIVEELREQARAVPSAVHDVGCDLRENALWLSRAWLSAVGVDGILYDRAAVMDCADDEDATDVGMDDFAPMAATMPKTLLDNKGRAQSVVEPRGRVGSPEAEGGALVGTPTVLMRL